jgi:hypothetical protein
MSEYNILRIWLLSQVPRPPSALNWNVEEGRRPSIFASRATIVATARRELSRMEVKT